MQDQVNDNIHVILGDFNIDAYGPNNLQMQQTLSRYKLVVDEPTHLSGSLLDHVYVRKDFMQELIGIECIIKCVFFSDHDAVKFQLNFSSTD